MNGTGSQNNSQEEIQLYDRVGGKTAADQIRHVQARIHFLDLLVDHLASSNIWVGWTIAVGLYPAVLQSEEKAKAVIALRLQDAPAASIAAAMEEYARHWRLLVAALKEAAPKMGGLVAAFVYQELQLDWHWLTAELVQAWVMMIKCSARGADVVKVARQYIPPESPPTVPGRYPNGRLRKDQNVERYVEWFFRLHVKHESKRSIARRAMDGSLFPKGFEYKHTDVTKYANLARTWLSFGFSDQHFSEIYAQLPQGDDSGSTSRLPPTSKP